MNTELNEFQKHSITTALHKLLNGRHFNICDFRKLAQILSVDVGGKDYMALEALHCVEYGEMGPELSRMVREKVVEQLGLNPAALTILSASAPPVRDVEPPEPKRLRLAFWRN